MKFTKKKKVPKRESIKEKKAIQPSTARKIALMVVLFSIISSPLNFLVSNNTVEQTKQMKKLLTTIPETSEKEEKDFSVKYQTYLNDFISCYINVPADNDAFLTRQKKLKEFYSFNFPEEKNSGLQRKIKTIVFQSMNYENDIQLAEYKITYEVKKDENYKEFTRTLKIRFVEKENQFKVVSPPFFSNTEDLKLKEFELPKQDILDGMQILESNKEKELNEFLTLFLNYYVTGQSEQLDYIMSDPEYIDSYSYSNMQPKFYRYKDKIVVYLTLTLNDLDTNSSHLEEMSLLITKKENKYFIEKITHYTGGILDGK